ncbi:MAG: hypothetical protein SXV54_05680 [Chloroflexota bacterium]|nr:hypothetical protein [Chloroflexota bacterium]
MEVVYHVPAAVANPLATPRTTKHTKRYTKSATFVIQLAAVIEPLTH